MTKPTIPEIVYKYMKKKNLLVKKLTIARELSLNSSSVDRACRILRRDGQVAFMRWGKGKLVKTYWGIK